MRCSYNDNQSLPPDCGVCRIKQKAGYLINEKHIKGKTIMSKEGKHIISSPDRYRWEGTVDVSSEAEKDKQYYIP